MARRLLHGPGVRWMLATAFLIQFAVPLARLATTYRAIGIGTDPQTIGWLAASFAALPMLMVVSFGRMTDRHGVNPGILAGAAICLAATALLWLLPPTLQTLLIGTALLGLGQTLHYTGLQMVVMLIAGRRHRDSALGSYLLAMTLGGALAPLLISTAGSDDPSAIAEHLFMLAMVSSFILMVSAIGLCRILPRRVTRSTPISIASILATPGLAAIIIAGSLCATVQDMLTIYIPVLGVERSLPASFVGLLVTVLALASVASRASYGWLAQRFGRRTLAFQAAAASVIGVALMGLVLPAWIYGLAVVVAGFGLGIAGTATVGLVFQLAPHGAGSTAMSIRQLASRVGGFTLPLGANIASALAGLVAIFGLLAATMAVSAVLVWRSKPKRGSA